MTEGNQGGYQPYFDEVNEVLRRAREGSTPRLSSERHHGLLINRADIGGYLGSPMLLRNTSIAVPAEELVYTPANDVVFDRVGVFDTVRGLLDFSQDVLWHAPNFQRAAVVAYSFRENSVDIRKPGGVTYFVNFDRGKGKFRVLRGLEREKIVEVLELAAVCGGRYENGRWEENLFFEYLGSQVYAKSIQTGKKYPVSNTVAARNGIMDLVRKVAA